MKIGTITFQRAFSYGARLQAFALVKYLNDLGHNAEVIDYSNIGEASLPKSNFKWAIHKYILKKIFYFFANKKEVVRRKKFYSFSEKFTPHTPIHYTSIESLNEIEKEYDLFISGSDQVWNPLYNRNDLNFLLHFVKDSRKKLSYAASFGTSELSQNTFEMYKKELATFDDILVREEEGAELVRQMLGTKPNVVLDPTFLIDSEIWKDIAIYPFKKQFKYILCFKILDVNPIYNKLIKHLQKITNYKLIVLDNPYQLKRVNGKLYCTGGPQEFLGLIKNASIVVTNSFHGTVFSILFNRPFYTVLNNFGLNSRLENLTEALNLSNRIISNSSLLPNKEDLEINFSSTNKLLAKKIQESKELFNFILEKHKT